MALEKLKRRGQTLIDRAANLDPIAGRVREIFARGKREQLLAGVDSDGRPFDPLAPSTLKGDPGRSRTPLVPHGANSRLITGYVVTTETSQGRLIVSAGWPGLDFVKYLRAGTRWMPRRDPGGFRAQDKAEALRILENHLRDERPQ